MYTRGQFSHIARISMKALRLYDEMGLLKPHRVDASNGYHYYNSTQLKEAARIQEWRRYGFSLQDMMGLQLLGDTEEDREELLAKLRERQRELEMEVVAKQQLIGQLAAHGAGLSGPPAEEDTPGAAAYEIHLGLAGGLYMLSCRQPTAVQDAGQLIGQLYEALFARSLTASGGHLLIYHQEGFEPESADLEAGLPVQLPDTGLATPEGLIHFPERLCASTRHTGSFSKLGLTHAAVLDWIRENGYEPEGPFFEQYAPPPLGRFHPSSAVFTVFYPVRIAHGHAPSASHGNTVDRGDTI